MTSWRVAESLQLLLAEIELRAPLRSHATDGSIGDMRHAGKKSASDHNPCACCNVVCARDFTHDPGADGFDSYAFAEWLRQRVAAAALPEVRVKYVISNGRIFSGHGQPYPAGLWRPYGGANRHATHVHVSVRHPAEHFDDTLAWGWHVIEAAK
jgi:hypothetical protein